jgi:hypothetical protein
VDRKRREPDGAALRELRQADASSMQPHSRVDAFRALQASVGNRAVAAAIQGASVQRQPTRTRANDGGALTLEGEAAIPLESATWSLKQGVKTLNVGEQRIPQLAPTKREVGLLTLTRRRDASSERIEGLMGSTHERGSLRLDRPTRDGVLPATDLALRDASIVGYGRGRDDPPTDTMTVAIGDLRVAGMGSEASPAESVGRLQVLDGSDAWPPIPVLSWDYDRPRRVVAAQPFEGTPDTRPSPHEPAGLSVTIAAGMGVTHLAEALDQKRRLSVITLSPKGRGGESVLREVLVVEVSSAEGPNVVKVKFAAEIGS